MDNALIHPGGELRVEARGLARVIRGYPIVFNRLSVDVGGFREIIAPEAITRTLREGVDLRALLNHNPDRLLGRVPKTLRVEVDAHGLLMELDPPRAEAGVVELVERGDLTGGSFAFQTVGESESWWDYRDPKMPVRTVRDMLVREVSLVAWPAYRDTAIAMRSADLGRQAMEKFRPAGRTASERLARMAATAARW